jgi:4'-phosphopantetheinyl transferase
MIDLWIIHTNEDPAQSAEVLHSCFDHLSEVERARAARFHFPIDQARFALCRSTLRRLLAEATGTPSLELQLGEGPYGKPFLIHPEHGPHFNLSHTKGLAVIALSKAHSLGVDTEAADRSVKALELAARVFTPDEISTLTPLEDSALTERFFRYWTAKEAFLKATGRGLSLDPRKLTTTLPDTATAAGSFVCSEEGIDASIWHLHEFPDAPGYRIALAAPAVVARTAITVHHL